MKESFRVNPTCWLKLTEEKRVTVGISLERVVVLKCNTSNVYKKALKSVKSEDFVNQKHLVMVWSPLTCLNNK